MEESKEGERWEEMEGQRRDSHYRLSHAHRRKRKKEEGRRAARHDEGRIEEVNEKQL